MYPRLAETEECPLCRIVLGKPRRTFVKHVARHMEEIALMALPRNTEEDSDGSSDSTDPNSLVSENAELLATNIVDLPPDTEEDWDEGSESSISTFQDSEDSEDSELQPVESAAEAGEERRWDCGHCGERGMSVQLDLTCDNTSCRHRRDIYATEY